MDEESPRNTSHLKGLGVTNMEKLGHGSASLESVTISPLLTLDLLGSHPILLECLLLSACQTCVKQ
jgi:hypothetical protein